MKPRHKRALIIVIGLIVIAVAAKLVLNALNSNIALYITPTEVKEGKIPNGKAFRIGGMVKDGSLKREDLTVYFVMTDMVNDVAVSYKGILPDLFKEGKGAVVQGKMEANNVFVASEVLAKHDENYMPPEAQHSLDKAKQRSGK